MKNASLIFVTGAIRSGTTLLTQLISSSLGTVAAMQPIPLFLVRLKAEFLSEQGAQKWHVAYPLADDIFSTSFDQNEFLGFLERRTISRSEAVRWLIADACYSGVLHHPTEWAERLDGWAGGSLHDLCNHYLTDGVVRRETVVWKEVFSESYIPYFVQNEVPSIIIIRDPRDVVLSQSVEGAYKHVGLTRPLLYQIRQWRKSVAWALWLKKHAMGNVVQFEDLLNSPTSVVGDALNSLVPNSFQKVELETFSARPNSSFSVSAGIDRSAIGRYKNNLDDETRKFVEAACFPEMEVFGYTPTISRQECLERLGVVGKNFNSSRPELTYYNYGYERSREELLRFRSYAGHETVYDRKMHITEAAFTEISGALRK